MPIITPKKMKTKTAKSQLDYIGGHFESFQKNGQGYKALCPLHDDTNPSLSINEGKDGRILICCHAGCLSHGVLEVVGLSMRDLMPGAKRIVAKYDYFDEGGELLYQAVRYEPKDFRQRKPKAGGGWVWSTKGVCRVLYRLPELLKADTKLPVYIVEGEKDVDRLREIGLLATCNVGGAGKWREDYNEHLAGRTVVISPDNDPAGWDHARNVARQLHGVAKSIKILELPDLAEKGDVIDWLDAGGTKKKLLSQIKKIRHYRPPTHQTNGPTGSKNTVGNTAGSTPQVAKNAVNTEIEPGGYNPAVTDPIPGGPVARGVAPFPAEALPAVLQRYAESVATALPCPVDFPATMMLSVLATFIGKKCQIAIKESWNEYPLLWIANVARSGDRKTPAFDLVTKPLRQRQKIFLAEYLEAKKNYKSLSLEEREEIPEPRLQQILTTDTTIEALKDVLTVNPNGIIYPADELSGWARSIGQYKGGRGNDRQIWLSVWSNTQIVTNRKSSPEPIVINEPFVCVTGGIQPDALPDLIDDSREDGFAARILFSWPDPIPHGNWSEATVQRDLPYASLCEQLFDLPQSKKPITVSAPAKKLWIKWVNAHRAELPSDNLRPTWSKAEGHCLRLTLVLHLARKFCNETKSGKIDEASMVGGIKLIEYFKSHAKRVYANLAITIGKDRIPRALRWIRKQGGSVTARLARQNGFTKDADEAKQLFRDLEELDHGTVTKGKQGNVTFTLRANTPTGKED